MDLTPLFRQMIILILIMGVGYALGKIRIIDPATKKKMTKLLLLVTSPAMIIDAFLDNVEKADSLGLFSMVPKAFLTSFVMTVLLLLLSIPVILLLRVKKERRTLMMMMTGFGNVGFMGFPVVSAVCLALWGEESVSVGLFYAAIFSSMFNILIYTIGVLLMTAGKGGGVKISPKTLLSPGVLSCVVGLVLFLLRVELPQVIAGTLDTLGGLTGPIAMLLVGATLSEMPPREIVRDWKTIVYAAIRQCVLPLIIWFAFGLVLKGGGESERLRVITLVLSAMPVANTVSLFATEYGGDEALAGRGVFVTTVLSVLTVPLLLAICL